MIYRLDTLLTFDFLVLIPLSMSVKEQYEMCTAIKKNHAEKTRNQQVASLGKKSEEKNKFLPNQSKH